jgi:exonuclease III
MGDLNTGIRGVDKTGESFYAEECFIGLLDQGWIDRWRSRHPSKAELSWYSRKGAGFGIDHALASPMLDERISSARYEHSVREARLSAVLGPDPDLDPRVAQTGIPPRRGYFPG